MAIWQDWFDDETGKKMKPEKQILLIGWAREGLTDKDIAKNIGIAESTVGLWKRKYPIFKQVLKQSKEVADFVIENALFEKAKEGDITAMIFWLKNRQPDKWQKATTIDQQAKEAGLKISHKQYERLEAEIEKLKADLASKDATENKLDQLFELIGRELNGAE